jgi:DNA mismatch repair protein MSH5
MFTLSDIMFVNADTLASLQIIQSENHPSSHMQCPNKSASGAKESLSVFGLFSGLARTPQGKQKLRKLFLRPSTDLSIIRERLHTIGVLLRPDNLVALEKIMKSLKMIRDMQTVVVHLQKGINNSKGTSIQRGVWANLQCFTFYTLQVLEGIRELSTDNQTLAIASKV